jgi:dipeptidyl aminopeptidase/acylaminoacyl peptidase
VAEGRIALSELMSDGSSLFWLESRPAEAGGVVLVRARGDGVVVDDVGPVGVSIRSRVHEYGGGAVCLVPQWGDGAFAYVDQVDQRVWFCAGVGVVPRPLTPVSAPGEVREDRHGALSASADGKWVLAVRETQVAGAGAEPSVVRQVVAIAVAEADGRGAPAPASVVLSGHDFFGTARLHPDGDRVLGVAWDHPDMQWDASRVVVVAMRADADAAGGGERLVPVGAVWELAGGPDESVGQVAWQHDGSVRYVSDRAGWWQPYRHDGVPDGGALGLCDVAAEFHGPDWNLSQCTMAEMPGGALVARLTSDGRDRLVLLSSDGHRNPVVLEQPCVAISAVCAHGEDVAYIGSTEDAPAAVWLRGLVPGAPARRVRAVAPRVTVQAAGGAAPFHVQGRSGRTIHGMFYPPVLDHLTGPPGQRPPLIVFCHSGPTTASSPGFDGTRRFFTTRGFAVACVDYAGSTGYGRRYRCALWGKWGVADAEDCLDAAQALAAQGAVDPARMAVRGSSAGGFTALNALAAGEGFTTCVAWFPVTDLVSLAESTHDFEAHYNDRLIGPLPASAALYEERSPLAKVSVMLGAVLLLQGSNDPVVPLAQSERLHQALVAAGQTAELVVFEGEGHGFRRAETLRAALEAELAFYRGHLGL